jgi:hypothetical protein
VPRYQWQAGSLESGASCFRYTQATKASKSSEKPKTTETSKASETSETAQTTNSAGWLVNLEFFGLADSVNSNTASHGDVYCIAASLLLHSRAC